MSAYQHGQRAWDSAFLDRMRCVGDPAADDAVDAMLQANEGRPEDTAKLLLRQLLWHGPPLQQRQ